MAVRDFAIDLIEELLKDSDLALIEENIRFYDKGTTAETDENLDDHIRWRNARYYNEDSNVVRSSLLIVQLPLEKVRSISTSMWESFIGSIGKMG